MATAPSGQGSPPVTAVVPDRKSVTQSTLLTVLTNLPWPGVKVAAVSMVVSVIKWARIRIGTTVPTSTPEGMPACSSPTTQATSGRPLRLGYWPFLYLREQSRNPGWEVTGITKLEGSVVTKDVWTHIAASIDRSAGTITLFKDGVADATLNVTKDQVGIDLDESPFTIGSIKPVQLRTRRSPLRHPCPQRGLGEG